MNLFKKSFEGNSKLKLQFSVKAETRSFISTQFTIGGLVVCKFRADVNLNYNPSLNLTTKITISEKISMAYDTMDIRPRIRSQCYGINSVPDADEEGKKVLFKISDDKIIPINDIWNFKGTVTANEQKAEYDLHFWITIEEFCMSPTVFEGLHEDAAIIDFELSGQDGSISMHKAVLAASSPMLSTMLSGQWKEASKGKVQLAGVSKETLTNLKAFMYLRKLPSRPTSVREKDEMHNQLEELLKLACYLMMPDLVQACSAQLLLDLTTDNVYNLLSLAGVHKIKSLMIGILLSQHHGSINVIENCTFPGDWI